MAEYRLSLSARRDLLDIAAHGAQRFGREQAIRYRDLLKQHFERLAENPEHYPAVDLFEDRLPALRLRSSCDLLPQPTR